MTKRERADEEEDEATHWRAVLIHLVRVLAGTPLRLRPLWSSLCKPRPEGSERGELSANKVDSERRRGEARSYSSTQASAPMLRGPLSATNQPLAAETARAAACARHALPHLVTPLLPRQLDPPLAPRQAPLRACGLVR